MLSYPIIPYHFNSHKYVRSIEVSYKCNIRMIYCTTRERARERARERESERERERERERARERASERERESEREPYCISNQKQPRRPVPCERRPAAVNRRDERVAGIEGFGWSVFGLLALGELQGVQRGRWADLTLPWLSCVWILCTP